MKITRFRLQGIIREELLRELVSDETLNVGPVQGIEVSEEMSQAAWNDLISSGEFAGEFFTGLDFEKVRSAFDSGDADQIAIALMPLALNLALAFTGATLVTKLGQLVKRIDRMFPVSRVDVKSVLDKLRTKLSRSMMAVPKVPPPPSVKKVPRPADIRGLTADDYVLPKKVSRSMEDWESSIGDVDLLRYVRKDPDLSPGTRSDIEFYLAKYDQSGRSPKGYPTDSARGLQSRIDMVKWIDEHSPMSTRLFTNYAPGRVNETLL